MAKFDRDSRKFFFAIFFFLFALTMVGITQAQTISRQTIYWYYNDFPPYFIISGPYQGKGSADVQMRILIARLPQFHHERVLASHSRSLEMVKTQPNACHAALFKTPQRETEMVFSAPVLQNLSNGFIALRTRAAQFKPFLDKQGQLRLDDFLEGGSYRLGIVAGRSFGSGVDDVLKKRDGQKSLVMVSANDGLSSRLLKLVTQHEYDAVMGYAYELQYVARHLQLNPRDFVFIPIAEQSPLQPIYVACSNSELGKQVIAAMNTVLSGASVQHEMNAAYRYWLDNDSAVRWDRLRVKSYVNQ